MRLKCVKRGEIWASGVSVQCVQATFDSQVVKVILGSFGKFPIFDHLVYLENGLSQSETEWNLGLGVGIQCIQGTFDS